jgi:hypothetical protein
MKSRRQFLQNTAAVALLAALHPACGFAAQPMPKKVGGSTLIRKIRLLTAVPLSEMKAFYMDLLGLPIIMESSDEIAFQAGNSVFQFVQTEEKKRKPFYHFAFNIPENKIIPAREWLLKRTPLVPTPPRLRDAKYPDNVRHFANWNAHSIFFFDPAFNVVECIARHDLDNAATGDFSVNDLLNISEIGFMVERQEEAAKWVMAETGLDSYPSDANSPWAVGDENGLLLCLPKGRVFGEGTATPVVFDIFPTWAEIEGKLEKEINFADFPYQIKPFKN